MRSGDQRLILSKLYKCDVISVKLVMNKKYQDSMEAVFENALEVATKRLVTSIRKSLEAVVNQALNY